MQDLREYELDYEAAKKAAASAAAEAEKEEERRIKVLEKNPLGDFMPEEEEMLNLGRPDVVYDSCKHPCICRE